MRRISIVRLFLVVAVIGGALAAAGSWALGQVADSRAASTNAWVAPYVDVTLTPLLHFEDEREQPADDVVLGFIVADPRDACEPSWGGYYSLDAAARALDLDRRIVRLRERGGDAVVSFGGAANRELALACTDERKLTAAYQEVIDRYELTAIDFDIEGAAVGDQAANLRRANAIKALQQQNPGLLVWFTLAVAPHGLSAEAVTIIDQLLQAGADLGGVNVMTMNYAESRVAGTSMSEANEAALHATWRQLDEAYRRAGQPLGLHEVWQRIGATPMIGQNDVANDVFTLSDARRLVQFADEVDLGRLSFWSTNRDVACGAAITDTRVSNTCSGVAQDPLEFTNTFITDKSARRTEDEPRTSTSTGDRLDTLTRDDPRTSPYPIWRSAKAYTEGAKVVWQGRVYEAKWWTQGNQPDAPVKHAWDTPWRYLGPVLESDRVTVRADDAARNGGQVRWSGEAVFVAGDRVEHEGKLFQAKWWTQGNPPEEDPDQPYNHPWEYLGKAKAE